MSLFVAGAASARCRWATFYLAGHFAFAHGVLHSGNGCATFRLNYFDGDLMAVGVFPADLELDSSICAAAGKRCALELATYEPTCEVVCDGVRSGETCLTFRSGDEVRVKVKFLSKTAARVTLSLHRGLSLLNKWSKTLRGVPECGLRFGVGFEMEGQEATLLELDYDPQTLRDAVADAEAAIAEPSRAAAALAAIETALADATEVSSSGDAPEETSCLTCFFKVHLN